MKNFLNRLYKILAYTGAGIVILLAVAVGLFRLMLPRLPEYQEEIKDWASGAIGMQVEFSGMDARWGLTGPELKFYGAELIRPDNQSRIVAAEEVGVGVSLIRLLRDRTLVVDSVTIRNSSVELRQLEDGGWLVFGTTTDELLPANPEAQPNAGAFEVIGQDIELQLIRIGDQRPTFFDVSRVVVHRDDVRLAIDASIRLPDELGGSVSLSATQLREDDVGRGWNVTLETGELLLDGLSELIADERFEFGGGRGSFDVSLAWSESRVASATANVDFEDVALGSGPAFDISGRFDISNDMHGWLVAADDLRLSTPAGDWPRTSMRVETSIDESGDIVMLDSRATHLNLADFELVMDWLDEEQRAQLDQLRPDGIVRHATATLSDLDTDAPRYSIAADFDGIGFAASGSRPGLRGFSGSLRADQARGRLEIESEYMILNLPSFLPEPVDIDAANGTVLWRRSGSRTTILSDSIEIRNSVLDSNSNVEITIDDGESPVIDLASTWSIDNINAAKRYIPETIMKPKLYTWFQDALVSGRIPSGSTRFYGPLDKFPFDNDEGRLLIEAEVRDSEFRYQRLFPAAEVSEMTVVLENASLRTTRNRSLNSGNLVIDADVEIADFRQPVLTIDAYSTGTLETIREFSANSPIERVFGGHLDKITVTGEAAFNLDLMVPLRDWRSFEFTARVNSSNGSLAIEGLEAPVTDLAGVVTIERESISSESLGGTFLGEPVSIDLLNAPDDMPEYRVIARARGGATGDSLVEELKLPLSGLLSGRTDYNADILFPRANVETPAALSINVDSDLEGLRVDLPAPFRKTADDDAAFAGTLRFLPGGTRIESSGEAGEAYSWQIGFDKVDDAWDLDRGVVMIGGGAPPDADVRGMHVRGQVDEVRFEEWLDLGRDKDHQFGLAERIRSIDVGIADLFAFGQHLEEHTVRVDRSALDWLVRINGDEVAGSIFVPYDFSADRALVLDMERLVLPGDDTDDLAPERIVDPRSLPAITVRAAEFALGGRYFGAVEAEFRKVEQGLATESIVASDPTFEVVGNGSWLADETDPQGSRSYITATLTSNNVMQTMQRLNYEPGIVSGDMSMLFRMSWSGGPRMDFLDTLDGEVQVRFGSGQLEEVDPGAGRVFGLMSIVALPRRLNLDFSDVFDKGFGFDRIDATFRIEDGNAWTCNLSLTGPAADVGLIGRVDLVNREYEQTAVVSASVGNTLPVLGGVVAGPQAAAALLLFSRIFRKPLQDIGQAYYSISGSFDEPLINPAGAEAFAGSGRLAGCIADSE